MRKAIKLHGKTVSAWRLGDNSDMEKRLIQEGKIKLSDGGVYEIFSREAMSGSGESANAGDYFKVDSQGYPYPNDKEFFEKKHRHIDGDTYEQLPTPLDVWFLEDGMCDEIQFLLDHKGLKINPDDEEKYFSAPLWGTLLSTGKDSAIVFYSLQMDKEGKITDIDFNFVAADEFAKTYTMCT